MPKYEYGREGAYLQNKVFTRTVLWIVVPIVIFIVLSVLMIANRVPAFCVAPLFLLFLPGIAKLGKEWGKVADKAIAPHAKGLRGEMDVAQALRQALGHDSYLVHDLTIGERGNIDHVAVTPGGIFSIETKAWTGAVFTQGDRLWVNRSESGQMLKQAFAESRAVRDYLDRVSSGWKHDVMPLLVFTKAKIGPPVRCRGVWVLGLDDLPAIVGSHTGVLDQLQRSRIAAALGTRVQGVREPQ